jgi:hypothetical protein
VQQQVPAGEISAQVTMKYLVLVARSSLEDCWRMAARVPPATSLRADKRSSRTGFGERHLRTAAVVFKPKVPQKNHSKF